MKTETEKDLTGQVCHLNVPDYDDYGKMLYDYLKYQVAEIEPEEKLPEQFQQQTTAAFNAAKSQTAGMDFTAKMNFLKNNGTASEVFSNEYLDFDSDVSAMIAAATGLDDVIDQISARELTLDLHNLSCDEQEAILALHSATRHLLLYLSEIWGNNGEGFFTGDGVQDRGCPFWQAVGCIVSSFDNFFVDVVGVVISAPTTGIGIAIVIYKGVKDFVNGVNEFKDCCNNLDCRAPRSVSLRFNDCTASATYTAAGFGSDDATLSWSNGTTGTPAFVFTPTSAPTVTITQNSPSIPVTTTITSYCSDGSMKISMPFVRDLSQLVLEVTGVLLTGVTSVYPPAGEQFVYSGLGLGGNANYSVQWFIGNGQIINSTNQYATVVWDLDMEQGFIQMQVTNNCPGGESRLFTLNVTGDGPIP